MRSLAFFLISIVFTLAFAAQSRAAVPGSGAPQIVISVDWEGRDLRDENLNAMIRLRNEFPEVKLVHFLNAAYFTKAGADRELVRARFNSVLRPGDELGLHIHGWHSLLTASGVAPRNVQTFWKTVNQHRSGDGDIGHDAIIEEYSVSELRQMIRFSVQTLNANGFHGIRSFRAGGWMAGPKVLEALVLEGFTADSSAVPAHLMEEKFNGFNLLSRLKKLWPKTGTDSIPYVVETPAGSILEFPNNSGLADYVTAEQFFEFFKQRVRSGPNAYVHYGFHQESAAHYVYRVSEGLHRVKRSQFWRGGRIESATLQTVVQTPRMCRDVF